MTKVINPARKTVFARIEFWGTHLARWNVWLQLLLDLVAESQILCGRMLGKHVFIMRTLPYHSSGTGGRLVLRVCALVQVMQHWHIPQLDRCLLLGVLSVGQRLMYVFTELVGLASTHRPLFPSAGSPNRHPGRGQGDGTGQRIAEKTGLRPPLQ